MSATDRFSGLQRRVGRRRSIPASPSSPTFQRRDGKAQDPSVLSATESTFVNTPADSPSIDITVPSPTFDWSAVSPALGFDSNVSPRIQPPNRASDDLGKNRPKFLSETLRPATSSAEGGAAYSALARTTYSPDLAVSREYSPAGNQHTSGDTPTYSLHRDQDEGSTQRAAAFWAQYDKATNEENTTSKAIVGSRKSRFNLLNPMSLLARRRSSQNVNKLEDGNGNTNKLHVPAMPDNIETSIRGTVIHDFSAPRSRRSNIENSPRPVPVSSPSPSYPRRPSDFTFPPIAPSAGTPASLHSAMFREHFQEEQRPVQPRNTAYLHGQNLHIPASDALPSFAKNLPLTLPVEEDSFPPNAGPPIPIATASTTHKILPPEPEPSPPPQPASPPPSAPLLPQQKSSSPVLEVPQPNVLPRHMTSTSSRFSFIGQPGSLAQEKYLEDKHKEHASKQSPPARLSVVSTDDMDGYDDYDGLDDEDGFDNDEIVVRNIDMPSSQANEQVPPIEEEDYDFEDEDEFGTDDIVRRNIDMPTSQSRYIEDRNDEDKFSTSESENLTKSANGSTVQHRSEDEFGKGIHRQSLQAFHFTPQSLSFSPSTAQNTSQSTPRDPGGLPIGMARTKEATTYDIQPRIYDSRDQSPSGTFFEGLGIITQAGLAEVAHSPTQQQPFDDGDLYFDDGEFDDDVIESVTGFDESLLDDTTHIKDIPAQNARRYEEALQRAATGYDVKAIPPNEKHVTIAELSQSSARYVDFSEPVCEAYSINKSGLTKDNLAAHHDALTMAINEAASTGKFDRTVSFSQQSDDETSSPVQSSMPGISSGGSRYSNNLMISGISEEDEYGFDDDMDDQAMIAAANAEALENDDDGFYGQEFGFYARAHTKDSAEFTSGGFFASRGSNGIKRSHSGKNNFQEPSLTPITERSEWSTRNSVVSLALHAGIPGGSQSLTSPGIAQLLERDSPIVDDEMSLSTLMKLRGRAFGGSSTSINSLGERHHAHSSPLAHMSGHNSVFQDGFSGRMSSPTPGMSGMGIAESEDEEEDEDEHGRHTLTQNTPHKKRIEPTRETSHSSREQEQVASSPISRKGNHSRNSSGAESVSYARDIEGRWVLERRRTGDDGEPELIGREYLAGAHI